MEKDEAVMGAFERKADALLKWAGVDYNRVSRLMIQTQIVVLQEEALTAGRAEVQAKIDGAPRAWFVEYDTGGSMMGHAYKPDTTWDPSYEAPRLVRLVPE